MPEDNSNPFSKRSIPQCSCGARLVKVIVDGEIRRYCPNCTPNYTKALLATGKALMKEDRDA